MGLKNDAWIRRMAMEILAATSKELGLEDISRAIYLTPRYRIKRVIDLKMKE